MECASLIALARVDLDLGNTKEATTHAQQALALAREMADRRQSAIALNVIGDIYAFTGRSKESLALYQQAQSISDRMRNRRGRAQALLNIGLTLSDLGRIADAQGAYRSALEIWRLVHDRRGEASTLTALGHAYVIIGEYQEALGSYRQARTNFEGLGDRFGIGVTLEGVGIVYFRSGDTETAMTYYTEAAKVFKAIQHKNGQGNSLMNLGACRMVLKRYREALADYVEALALFRAVSDRRLEARVLQPIGDIYAELGDFALALSYYQQATSLARTVGDAREEVYALNSLGALMLKRGSVSEALKYFNDALQIGQGSKNRFAESLTLYNLARVDVDRGQLDRALVDISDSLSIVETLRGDVASLELRASYLASMRDRYELEIDILMRLHKANPTAGYLAKAFHVSEQALARSLLDGLAQAHGDIRAGVAPALLEREAQARRLLNATAHRLTQIQNDADHSSEIGALAAELDQQTALFKDIEAQIRAESPRYASFMQPQPLTLGQVQQLVANEDTVLVEYFLGKTSSYVWAVSRHAVVAGVLASRAQIETAARGYRDALVSDKSETTSASVVGGEIRSVGGLAKHRTGGRSNLGHDLSRLVLAPVADSLKAPRIIVVADGALHAIPFGAMADPNDAAAVALRPLIVNHEIVQLPSASTLALLRSDWNQKYEWRRAAIVFADPVYNRRDARLTGAGRTAPASDAGTRGGGLSRLIHTRREAFAITAVAKPADLAVGFDATRSAAMSSDLARYRIVHFAAHATVDNDRPELSGIVLSLLDRKGREEDGFLRLYDIYNLKIPADLVVLSACSTALGKEVAGEGLISLVRGFMYAGTRRVVASLWEVDDEATSEVMAHFYRAMFEGKLPPAAALRAAQLAMVRTSRWKSPFYWAGFTLQGDWN